MKIGKKRGKIVALLIIFLLSIIISFQIGRYPIGPFELIKILVSRVVDIPQTWPDQAETVVFNIRLPRIVLSSVIGASLALNFEVFSVSYLIDDVISYRSNELFFGWEEMLDSSTFSFSLRYPEYTSMGDLTLFRPRIGFSVNGNVFDISTITFNAALEMQLLPTLSLQIAAAYREYNHKAFNFDRFNGVLMLALSLQRDNYEVNIMCNVDTGYFNHVYPAIAFTLSR